MSGKCVEIAIQLLHVRAPVHDALTSVHDGDRPHGMRRVDNPAQFGPCAERIRRLRHGDGARTPVEQRRQQFGAQTPFVVEGQHPDFGPFAFAQHLPRNDIGVVLHFADDDVVARTDEFLAPRIGHRIERSRRAGRENHLFLLRRLDKGAGSARATLRRASWPPPKGNAPRGGYWR